MHFYPEYSHYTSDSLRTFHLKYLASFLIKLGLRPRPRYPNWDK